MGATTTSMRPNHPQPKSTSCSEVPPLLPTPCGCRAKGIGARLVPSCETRAKPRNGSHATGWDLSAHAGWGRQRLLLHPAASPAPLTQHQGCKPSLGAPSPKPGDATRRPPPHGYLGRGWCPRSRTGWWSACCSRWSTAASPGCSSGAPGSAPVSTPWPGRWRRGTPPRRAAGARQLRQPPKEPPKPPQEPSTAALTPRYLGGDGGRRHSGSGGILGAHAQVGAGG